MSFNAPGPAPGQNHRKVAIPRLQRPSQSKSAAAERRRVSRACTACRSHKIKCSGDTPQCKHCGTTGRECVYILPRKDRLKTVSERCMQMAGLLKNMRHLAQGEDHARIGELLEATEGDMVESHPTPTTMSNPDTNDDESMTGRTFEQWQKLTTESLDLLDENLHGSDQSRATGFVGQNSDVQWFRSILLSELVDAEIPPDRATLSKATTKGQVSSVSYYLDHESIELNFHVDPYGLPAIEVAEKLFSVYMDKVQDSFPILNRRVFEAQFTKYFNLVSSNSVPRANSKWHAVLNMIFAIGAKYLHLVQSWEGDRRDHLIYRARACALAFDQASVEQHPDLLQIQVTGLLAFYYLSIGQLSRAWTVVGIAIRYAIALGLHVRNDDRNTSYPTREILINVWWSLYYLERQIVVMTGRPGAVVDVCCSVPLPAPLSEQQTAGNFQLVDDMRRSSATAISSPFSQSHPFLGARSLSNAGFEEASPRFNVPEVNPGSFFKAVAQLSTITQSIVMSLYTPGTRARSPNDLQQDIHQLGQRLDGWLAKLPKDFTLQRYHSGLNPSQIPFLRERTLLTFQYYSTKILLTRPCLGSLRESGQHAEPAEFAQQMADICVETAKAVVDVLPDQAHPLSLYQSGPWWTIVHNLMQALAVLLLALSYASEVTQDTVGLASPCVKIIRWLHSMDDPLAVQAYKVAVRCFSLVADRLGLQRPDEMPLENQFAVPSTEQAYEMQIMHPGALTLAPGVTYRYPRMPDDPSSGIYIPPDAQTYGQTLFYN
ncbi:hypothetical protein BU23DRAFT_526171 [Bimuria novae-zelandiae CBS 107.79]|uniref:Zn(2)-C6 fungal-type domain-containing protein n=1 Tax=Bimuria novae-zelandiae CBS 107.79 TaxID=1447943 RepID=A0A6A5VJ91_9PLEO|nr:hypothetical protein BU23DRAFT_526171 [Bimuria novae-zelandiae CBS 107.79]